MGTYYRNVVTVEFLSAEPWGDEAENLEILNYEITDGNGRSIGWITRSVANEQISRADAVAADIRMGGDGRFIAAMAGDEDSDEEEEN